eukprot:1159935-Pelagomonas_calceolata.AAC.2
MEIDLGRQGLQALYHNIPYQPCFLNLLPTPSWMCSSLQNSIAHSKLTALGCGAPIDEERYGKGPDSGHFVNSLVQPA